MVGASHTCALPYGSEQIPVEPVRQAARVVAPNLTGTSIMAELYIPQRIVTAMIAQARREAPLEACGILSGANQQVANMHEMTNADHSEDHFSLLPEEQFATIKKIRAADETMLAVYHSHPASPARPSEEDIRLAFMPGIIHVILSLLNPDQPEIKGFRIDDNAVAPVSIVITEASPDYREDS